MSTPLRETDCTNCKCLDCVYDCQDCVWRDDTLPDCRLYLMPECSHYITEDQMDDILMSDIPDSPCFNQLFGR